MVVLYESLVQEKNFRTSKGFRKISELLFVSLKFDSVQVKPQSCVTTKTKVIAVELQSHRNLAVGKVFLVGQASRTREGGMLHSYLTIRNPFLKYNLATISEILSKTDLLIYQQSSSVRKLFPSFPADIWYCCSSNLRYHASAARVYWTWKTSLFHWWLPF